LGQYDDETEIFWATGCALFIRRADFWKMKGFDERFFAHQVENTDETEQKSVPIDSENYLDTPPLMRDYKIQYALK
jgi:hypothetical protein